jgi:hypothetical protein
MNFALATGTGTAPVEGIVREVRSPQVVRILCALGFAVQGTTPIRIVLSRGAGRKLIFVPRHGPISDRELRSILADAAVADEDFERMRSQAPPERRPHLELEAPTVGVGALVEMGGRLERMVAALWPSRAVR